LSDSKFWIENGKRMLEEKSKQPMRTNQAKNVIMFLGDGMSLTTLTAARIYKGQLQNTSGESEHLSFEQFPFTGISKVNNLMTKQLLLEYTSYRYFILRLPNRRSRPHE